jgi:uncharacterized protein (DUF58 family)
MASTRRTAVCREGWYYLVIFLLVLGGALVNGVNLLVVLAGLLAGPLLLSRFMAVYSLKGVQARRQKPQGVCAGEVLVAGVTLCNTRRHVGSWAVVVEEQIRRAGRGPDGKRRRDKPLQAAVFFPYLPARQTRKGSYRGRLAQRGRYQLGPLRLSTRWPFGLFCHTVTDGQTESLIVFPRLGRLTRGWIGRHRQSFAGTNRREQRSGGDGDFYGVRPWQRGDGRRAVHARTSARTGKLMVLQFEQPRNRDVALVLDLWQPQRPAPAQRENVELAVSFAATVVADLCRRGDSNVYLSTFGARAQCGGGPASAALLQDLMERLALIEGQERDGLAALLDETFARTASAAELVLITTRPVDLGDPARLGPLAADPARRALLRRLRVIDTSGADLGRYFQME